MGLDRENALDIKRGRSAGRHHVHDRTHFHLGPIRPSYEIFSLLSDTSLVTCIYRRSCDNVYSRAS